MGQTGIRSKRNLYGIEVLNPSDNFWGIRFPRQKELEGGHARVLLKCAACQNCHVTALNEIEVSVFQITNRLTRMCDVCSANTVWEPVPDKTFPEELLATGKKPEKRKYGRINMKTVACVGPLGPHADIVDVVNISRGRICFRSSQTYHEDGWVQIAVPYTQGAANIFVAGCVVRSRKIGNDLTEYGVEYVKSQDQPTTCREPVYGTTIVYRWISHGFNTVSRHRTEYCTPLGRSLTMAHFRKESPAQQEFSKQLSFC